MYMVDLYDDARLEMQYLNYILSIIYIITIIYIGVFSMFYIF